MDWDPAERARYLAGLKGYVTNITPEAMTGEQVVRPPTTTSTRSNAPSG